MTDKALDLLEFIAGAAISAGFIFIAAYAAVGGIWCILTSKYGSPFPSVDFMWIPGLTFTATTQKKRD